VLLEGLGRFKKSSDLVGKVNRDLPACSIVPQPSTLPCAPCRIQYFSKTSTYIGVSYGCDCEYGYHLECDAVSSGRNFGKYLVDFMSYPS
jgi:hypothetical protein